MGQLIAFMPNHVTRKHLLWSFMLVLVAPLLANTVAIRNANSRVAKVAATHMHPIEDIITQAESGFQELLHRQSTSLADAEQEYKRRYKMEPPPGFDAWFQYAVSHGSKIIDDYDTMYSTITRFWSLSGQRVRQAMREIQQSANADVWTCKRFSKSGEIKCAHPRRSFDRHISDLLNNDAVMAMIGIGPDVEFLVNHLDEPRVLLPTSESTARTGIKFTDLSHRSTWQTITQYCRNVTQRSDYDMRVNKYGLRFLQDRAASMDICRHQEYEHLHGLFRSPTSMHLMEGVAPVLSTGAPSIMRDILFPSPAYIEKQFAYSPTHDLDWDLKRNNVYWAGSTSGAFATGSGWSKFHRQRFVGFAQYLQKAKNYAYLALGREGVIEQVTSSFLNSRFYDVAFTKIYQGTRQKRREQMFFYNMKAWADKNEAFRSRFVFDLDGNGISSRWYRFLASKSVPLRQTLLREWHDDRLVPWVHYVPVSQSMGELPELVAYLTSTPEGRQHAKASADQGAEWFQQALRHEDMGIYVCRLLLELARLQDPDRHAYPQ